MKQFLSLIMFVLSSLAPLFAQNINYAGVFPTIDHSGQLSEKLSYNSYLFGAIKPYSTANDPARALYLYTENGMSWQLFKSVYFTNSYVYERQQPFEFNSRNEHRLFQQITIVKPKRNHVLKHRIRFDERFIQNRQTENYPFSHRLRYLLGGSYNINPKWYLMGYVEVFFNTMKGAKFQFNENWSALQLGYKINETHAIEAGYLFVGWILSDRNIWFNQHYLQTTWVSKFNFKRSTI